VPRAAALFACGIGAAMIIAGLYLSTFGRKTRGFTRTPGRVLVSHVDEIPAPAEEGGPRFRSVIRYTYEARGRTYESEHVSVGSSAGAASSDPEEARRWVERYPAGSDVDVWFDPADPRRSVLVRGVSTPQVVAAVAIGLALIGLGIFALAR
jgi:hypothetical protein